MSESIQFNNKDVHLDKGINQARNSMKCDAIHRTLSRQERFLPTHAGEESRFRFSAKDGSSFGVTQHNHRFRNRVFVYVAPSVMMSQPFHEARIKELSSDEQHFSVTQIFAPIHTSGDEQLQGKTPRQSVTDKET